MSYKVLVADDEYIIRRGIIGLLRQYEDFEVAAEAEDGDMAFELACQTQPDVYFVDINMPFLNGLGFIEKLKTINPKAIVVVITGYDRFEYARAALKLGVFEYLLKPIMEVPFQEMINRVRERLRREQSEDKYLEWARGMMSQNRTYLASSFLQKLLDGHYSGEEISERSGYLSLNLPEHYTITISALDYQKSEDVKGLWNEDLIYFVAENIAGELFNDLDSSGSCQDRHSNLVVISEAREQAQEDELVNRYISMLKEHLPVDVTVVQQQGQGYETLAEIYENTLHELNELKAGSPLIKDIRRLIEEQYIREDFSIQDAANHVNLSVQHLSKIFRKELGVTFVDYLTSVRMRKAIELLLDEELKIYEIAELTGYANQHYFSNVFKKHLGSSPAEYRKIIKR